MIPGALELMAVTGQWLTTYPPATGGWGNLARDGAAWIAQGASLATSPERSNAALAELANRSQVFALVRGGGLLLGTPTAGFPPPLEELVERSYRLGDFPALWAVEGLGHDVTQAYLERGITPRRLLRDAAVRALPAKSRLMLHAGLGLALAEHLFTDARRSMPAAEIRRRTRSHLELCRANARPGDLGAALESLGLFVGLFQAPLVAPVERALREVAPDVVRFFWHGVGRGFYFRPGSFPPGGTWPGLAAARRLAPDAAARLDATAGFAWAATLVNQRQPWILERLLVVPHGAELSSDGAFANGVASATVMRVATTPGAPFVARFCDHRPKAGRRLWRRLAGQPCRRAVDSYLPALRHADRLGEVFRYQDLDRLIARGEAWR